MFTLLLSLISSFVASVLIYFISYSYIWSIIVAILVFFGINFLTGRKILKKLTALFNSIEKDLQKNKSENAINKLQNGLKYAKWQFFVKEQINSQIGIIYYTNKQFDKAKSYLEKGFTKHWMGMSMLAALYFKEKHYEDVKRTMQRAIKKSPKEGFLYSTYAYFLYQLNEKNKAMEIMVKGNKKVPMDDKLASNLDALKNGKRMKIQNYGHLWMQLNIEKAPHGVKPYQMFLSNKRGKRR